MNHLEKIDNFHKVTENYSSEKILDENSTLYNEKENTITGLYHIVEQTPSIIKILNIKEYVSESATHMDGTSPIQFDVYYVTLPKSQVKILDISVDDNYVGFNYIEIPYWLYKKNSKELSIKRLGRNYKLRGNLDITFTKLGTGDYMKHLSDDNVRDHLIILGNDIRKYDYYKNWYQIRSESKLPRDIQMFPIINDYEFTSYKKEKYDPVISRLKLDGKYDLIFDILEIKNKKSTKQKLSNLNYLCTKTIDDLEKIKDKWEKMR